MNKTESQFFVGSGTVQLNDFSPDATYPATVTGGTTLVVQGSGAVTINWAAPMGFGSATIQLRRNGTSIDSGNGSARNWTGTLADGDQLTLWKTGNQTASANSAYVDVIPQ